MRPGGLFLFADWQLRPTLHPIHQRYQEMEAYIPRTVAFYNAVSCVAEPFSAPPLHYYRTHYDTYHVRNSGVVSNWVRKFPHLILQTGSFEEPVSKQWAMPISRPYYPNLKCSQYSSHQFISEVMTRISHGFADALVDGGYLSRRVAVAFKDEILEKEGICSIYQTVWAYKKGRGHPILSL